MKLNLNLYEIWSWKYKVMKLIKCNFLQLSEYLKVLIIQNKKFHLTTCKLDWYAINEKLDCAIFHILYLQYLLSGINNSTVWLIILLNFEALNTQISRQWVALDKTKLRLPSDPYQVRRSHNFPLLKVYRIRRNLWYPELQPCKLIRKQMSSLKS